MPKLILSTEITRIFIWPRGFQQKKLQNRDSMQLEGGFGGMQLKSEMNLQTGVGLPKVV
jgi:hypothetical protein